LSFSLLARFIRPATLQSERPPMIQPFSMLYYHPAAWISAFIRPQKSKIIDERKFF